ncbi:hypothetical protein CERZMDRAFT_32252 [Cercospora zeae-maydis SCOH1-5]|uniref:Uncharacterized protein n=1 Tax=Cercospora zeae-maydis SCOH1-5 TaxID=717836 RepID=A0A6A6FTH9_9PEZI|nr:hypothetical protein CERZMDRAFT_32252 [Cercospora zeae-maydis SCOH1-5]
MASSQASSPGPAQSRRSARNRHPASDDKKHAEVRQRAHPKESSSRRKSQKSTAEHEVSASQETTHEDDLCPICQVLLYRPVTTKCNHTMCEFCMAHWADVSVNSQMKIVDVDEVPETFDAVSGIEAKCPMCRTQTTASYNPDLAARLADDYPVTTRERSLEEADSLGEQGGIQTLTVYVGNRHRYVADSETANCHEWTFFVKPSRTDIIEEVQLVLHPTFRPSRVIRQRAPYEVRRLGWGTFAVTAYVILKAGYRWVSSEAENSPDGAEKGMLPLEWMLDFEGFGGKGSMGGVRLKVKNDREWDGGVSDEEQRDTREWQRVVRSYQRDGVYEPPAEED